MAYEARPERDYNASYAGGSGGGAGAHEGNHGRGRGKRAITDYSPSMIHWMRNRRERYKGGMAGEMERPHASYAIDMLPPAADLRHPVDAIPAKHLHASLNKIKHPVNIVRWTPEGRRLLTGSSSGEFTLWNGMGFNFETIMQAHDSAIRAASYSHSDDWLLSADQDGVVKYWQPNFNNVKVIQAHNDPVRDISFSPTDSKFVTASDDSTLKLFDFAGGVEESLFQGHNWDVKSVDWHPTKGLLVSGSKDHLVKLWDPRTGRCLTTLRGHKNTISKTIFERIRGQLLATCARDQVARVFDLRMMRDVCLLKGHEKDISTLAWHPVHPSLLSTGGADGTLFHYLLNEPNPPAGTISSPSPYDSAEPGFAPAQTIYPAHRVPFAHDFAIWSLDWHPLGHILASGSNDRITRFWTRARPGETDCFNDRYHIGEAAAEAQGTYDRMEQRRQLREQREQEVEDEAEGLEDQQMPTRLLALPGLPGMSNPFTNGVYFPGMGSIPPPPPLAPGFPGLSGPASASGFPAIDPANPPDYAKFAALVAANGVNGQVPPPPPPSLGPDGKPTFPTIPPAGGFPNGIIPPGLLPPGFQMPPGFSLPLAPPPPGPGEGSSGAIPNMNTNGSVRQRGPLPSQEESLALQQRHGNFRIAH